MDAEFKQIVDCIEAEGLKKDTVVIFCGENGSSIIPDKEWLYDAGIHVPLITRWPSRIKPGGLSSDLVSMLDVTAGIAKQASGTVPKQMDGQPLFEAKYRGHSFIAAARGRSDEKWDAVYKNQTVQIHPKLHAREGISTFRLCVLGSSAPQANAGGVSARKIEPGTEPLFLSG
jgi:arylsulfatase A-like enzyme